MYKKIRRNKKIIFKWKVLEWKNQKSNSKTKNHLLKFQKAELTEHMIYKRLAGSTKDTNNKKSPRKHSKRRVKTPRFLEKLYERRCETKLHKSLVLFYSF